MNFKTQKSLSSPNATIGCWLVVLKIYDALALFQPYRDLEAGDNKSLKILVERPGIEPGPLALQAKSLTTRQPPLTQTLRINRSRP